MKKSTEVEVRGALNIIMSDVKSFKTSLNYAINYVDTARSMTGHELAVQCLYILNNITRWRHPEAKNVRLILKSFKG